MQIFDFTSAVNYFVPPNSERDSFHLKVTNRWPHTKVPQFFNVTNVLTTTGPRQRKKKKKMTSYFCSTWSWPKPRFKCAFTQVVFLIPKALPRYNGVISGQSYVMLMV